MLVVGINPGGYAGGSGDQYFVGDFDGSTFTSDDPGSYTPPAGSTLQGFDSGTYAPSMPMSYTETMFGWHSAATARASRRKRATARSSEARWSRRSLIATGRLRR